MQEIELKILNIDVAAITKKLIHMGATQYPEQRIIAKHFDFPDLRLKKKGEVFRIRTVGDTVEVCYKHSHEDDADFCAGQEEQTEVTDFDAMVTIIEQLGMFCRIYHEKKRTSFKKDNLKFEIDTYPDIPAYLEIEGERDAIKAAIKELGYAMKDTTSLRARQVIESYGADGKMQKFT